MLRRTVPFGLAACALIALIPVGARSAGSRYEPLMSTTAGQDTLRNIALWEDQRVTDQGRIFEYLKEGSPLVRRRVLEAIGRMQEPQDAPRVIPSLKDRNREVVREAVFALGQIGNRDAVTPLLAARAGATPEDAVMIADALGKLGGDSAVEALIDMLREFSSSVRGAAALALARNRSEVASAALLLAVHDPDPSVKWKAVYALEKQDPLPRTCQMLIDCLESPEPLVRVRAARTLGKVQCHRATRALVKLLEGDDLPVVINSARSLGELKARDAVRPLGMVLMTHKSHQARAAAAEALEKIGERGAKDALLQGMMDTSVLVRVHCVRALAACLGEKSEMFIDQARRDGSRLVRAEAIACYGRAGMSKRITDLDKIASGDKDPMMRAAAVSALGELKDPGVPQLLIPKLQDADFTVSAAAVDALGKHAHRPAIAALVGAYYAPRGREFVDVQIEAVRVLGELGAVEAESLLVEAVSHDDYRVRDAAGEAFKKLGKTPPAVSPTRAARETSYDRSRRKLLAPPTGTRRATIVTSRGDIEVELFGDDAVQTVANFLNLAKRGFFKDLTIHRVVPDFVIQGGDPRGDGSGDAGYTVPAEVSRHEYGAGYLGIADAGKDTGSCQWFITLSPQPHLNGRYTIFGRVTKGMDVVWKIDRGDTFDVISTD